MGLNVSTELPVITDLNTIIWFGRYKDCLLKDILQDDPAYLVWAQNAIDEFDLHYTLLEIAERHEVTETEWEKQTDYFWRLDKETNGT